MASPKYHHGQEWVGATQDEGSFKPLPACAEGNQAPTIPPIMMNHDAVAAHLCCFKPSGGHIPIWKGQILPAVGSSNT